MKVVILAGGLGTRISEETDRIPKPMVEIGGKPLIWHIMKGYAHHGIRDFIVCLGYRGYVIKEYFSNFFLHTSDVTIHVKTGKIDVHANSGEDWRVTLVDTGANTMTGGRIARVKDYLDGETFCLTYGDGLSDINFTKEITFHRNHGKKATVAAIAPPGRFGMLDVTDERVKSFAEKLDNTTGLINGGFFVLEPSVMSYIDGDETMWEQQPLRRLAEDGELMAFRHEGFWQPMDTLREKRALEELWASKSPPWAVWQDRPE